MSIPPERDYPFRACETCKVGNYAIKLATDPNLFPDGSKIIEASLIKCTPFRRNVMGTHFSMVGFTTLVNFVSEDKIIGGETKSKKDIRSLLGRCHLNGNKK